MTQQGSHSDASNFWRKANPMNRAFRATWVAAAFLIFGALEGVVEAQDDTAAAVFERLRGLSTVALDECVDGVGSFEMPRVRIDPEAGELLEVLAALPQQIGFAKVFVGHVAR